MKQMPVPVCIQKFGFKLDWPDQNEKKTSPFDSHIAKIIIRRHRQNKSLKKDTPV